MSLYWVGPKILSRFSSLSRKTLHKIFLPAQYLAEKERVEVVANHSAIYQCLLLAGGIFGSPQMLATQISFLPVHRCSANTACLTIPSSLSVLHFKIHLWTMPLKSRGPTMLQVGAELWHRCSPRPLGSCKACATAWHLEWQESLGAERHKDVSL